MNSAEFAESQGFSRPYVTKLVQQGVIVRDATGQIDKEAALAALAARHEPAKSLRRRRPGQNGEIIAPGGQGGEALSTLMLKTLIKTEFERGKLAELDRKRRESELVERRDVEEAAFECARNVHDALMNIPGRVSSLYAAETDPHKIHQSLEDEIRRVLIDLVGE